MSRFEVIAVQGARSDSPWMPGTAIAWLIDGVKNFRAFVELTWSIAQVPHTDAWACGGGVEPPPGVGVGVGPPEPPGVGVAVGLGVPVGDPGCFASTTAPMEADADGDPLGPAVANG